MTHPIYARYPGTSDQERATAYLNVNRVGFNSAHPGTRQQMAHQLVRDESARLMLASGAGSVVEQVNTPLGRLKARLDPEGAESELAAALKEDPEGVRALLEAIVAKLPKKDEAVTASAQLAGYPGANNVQRAIAMLSATRPGFTALGWSEQNRIAGEYLQLGAASASSAVAGPALRLANPPAGASTPSAPQAHLAALTGYPGANNVAKAIAMLSDKQPGFKLQPWSEQNRIAGNFVDTGVVR